MPPSIRNDILHYSLSVCTYSVLGMFIKNLENAMVEPTLQFSDNDSELNA